MENGEHFFPRKQHFRNWLIDAFRLANEVFCLMLLISIINNDTLNKIIMAFSASSKELNMREI